MMTGDNPNFSFSHVKPRDTPYVSEGLRDFFLYRDLGIAKATAGKVIAHLVKALLLDQSLLGLTINVLANVKLKAHDEETLVAFEQAAAEQPAIVDCFAMGGDSDYALRIVVGSIDEYERLLKKTLLHFPGVTAMSSHFALKCVKNSTKLPI